MSEDLPTAPMAQKLAELGLHLRDSLGAMNQAFAADAITHDQWSVLMDATYKGWRAFEATTGVSVDACAQAAIKVALGRAEWPKGEK